MVDRTPVEGHVQLHCAPAPPTRKRQGGLPAEVPKASLCFGGGQAPPPSSLLRAFSMCCQCVLVKMTLNSCQHSYWCMHHSPTQINLSQHRGGRWRRVQGQASSFSFEHHYTCAECPINSAVLSKPTGGPKPCYIRFSLVICSSTAEDT